MIFGWFSEKELKVFYFFHKFHFPKRYIGKDKGDEKCRS